MKLSGLSPFESQNKDIAEAKARIASRKWKETLDKDAYTPEAKGRIDKALSMSTSKTEAPTSAKKTAPVIAVKKTTVVAKPKSSTPAKSARSSMADEWAAFSKGREADTAALKDITDRYAKTGTLVNPEPAAEDMNTQGKLDAAENSEYKKGGQIKRRPPKPAKKAPAKRFASGGMSRSSASKRGDGCATKGHTKGRVL